MRTQLRQLRFTRLAKFRGSIRLQSLRFRGLKRKKSVETEGTLHNTQTNLTRILGKGSELIFESLQRAYNIARGISLGPLVMRRLTDFALSPSVPHLRVRILLLSDVQVPSRCDGPRWQTELDLPRLVFHIESCHLECI